MPKPPKSGSSFRSILEKFEVRIHPGKNEIHQIADDKTSVIKKLKKEFKSDLRHPSKANDFVESFIAFLESDDVELVKALKPLGHISGDYQDSLVKVLLQVDDIQTRLIEWLMEKMVFMAMTDEEDKENCAANEDIALTQLILSQISWLNLVQDKKKLADKVAEIITLGTSNLQKEVIVALPEIVDESMHSVMAMQLRDLMKEKPELINVILHAFTTLHIEEDVLREVRHYILKTVATVKSEDLPIIVKFLIEDLSKENVREVVEGLRENINFERSQILTQLTQQSQNCYSKSSKSAKDVDSLIIHIIKMAMYSNVSLRNAWIQTLELIKVASDQRPLDMLLFILLHHFPNSRKSTESLFKSKIRAGNITEKLIKMTASNHAEVIKEYLVDYLEICSYLAVSNEPQLNYFATILYREAFIHLDDFGKQEIIVDLITKCTSAYRSIPLITLTDLAFNYSDSVIRYSYFLEGILDNSQTFSLPELRQVMDILFFLAYNKSKSEISLRNNLHIIVKKQISSLNERVFKMGVVSAVMAVKNMATCCDEADVTLVSEAGNTSRSLSNEDIGAGGILKKAKSILMDVHKKSMISGDAGGLFMDELSNVISLKRFDRRLEKWVSKLITNDFTDDYVVDLDDNGCLKGGSERENFIEVEIKYNCDEHQDIALNVCSLIVKNRELCPSQTTHKCTKIEKMIPNFRLLKICVSATARSNNLEDIDALLGCPLLLPSDSAITEFSSLSKDEKYVILDSLFYTINWFIELINAFATQDDQELKEKVVKRLKQISTLRRQLCQCLKHEPRYRPPKMSFLASNVNWKAAGSLQKADKVKGRKRKADADSQDHNEASGPAKKKLKTNQDPDVVDMSLDNYAPFFREFDLDVFSIFSYNTVNINPNQDDSIICNLENALQLDAQEFLLLVCDFHQKLKHILIQTKSTKRSFPGKGIKISKESCFANLTQLGDLKVAEYAVGQLVFLLGHMDVMSDYFKKLLMKNDEVVDENFDHSEPAVTLAECLNLIFSSFKIILNWNGFDDGQHKDLLKNFLCQIGQRKNPNLNLQKFSVQELASEAFDHLKSFETCIINMSCAESQISLLTVLAKLTKREAKEIQHLELTKSYLEREWFDQFGKHDHGSKFNSQVVTLLNILFDSDLQLSQDAYDEYVCNELHKGVSNFGRRRKEPEAEAMHYKTFNKQTFGLHYKVLLQQMVKKAKSIPKGHNDVEKMEIWKEFMSKMSFMTDACKINHTRPILCSVLKFCRQFFDLFVKDCLPILDKQFRKRRELCIEIISSMQVSTRYLQHVVTNCKTSNDSGLNRQVPALKKSLDSIMYKVKEVLFHNGVMNTFQIGTLKDRDLSGEIISKQNVVEDEQEEGNDDEEELPAEDEEDSEVELEQEESDKKQSDDSHDISMAI